MSGPTLTRREFLRGRRTDPKPLRPPWTLPESAFTDVCTRCNACERECPEGILTHGDDGFPTVDFNRGECTFCGRCANACAAGAFDLRTQTPWRTLVTISDSCLARNGVSCQSCGDVCASRALRLRYLGAIPVPMLDAAACTGCGACVGVCPTAAIAVRHITTDPAP